MGREVAIKSATSFAAALQATQRGIVSQFLAFRRSAVSLGKSLTSWLQAVYSNSVRLTVGSFTIMLFLLRSMKALLLLLVKATAKKLANLSSGVSDNVQGVMRTLPQSSNGFVTNLSLVVDSALRGLLLMAYSIYNIGIRLPLLGLTRLIHAIVSSIIGGANSGLNAMSFASAPSIQHVQHRTYFAPNAVVNMAPSAFEVCHCTERFLSRVDFDPTSLAF